jgi:hypothetical protein
MDPIGDQVMRLFEELDKARLNVEISSGNFEDADFVFSTQNLCSIKLHGWGAAKSWLEHYPNMEMELDEYDRKYNGKGS